MKTIVPVILKDILVYWKTLLILATPLLLLPLVLVLGSSEAKCAYVLLIMAVYWVTEAFPLAVTALIPIVLFPLLGIMKGKDVCSLYIADTSMTFLAGLMMALAIERVQLHRRIGTGILLKVGATPTRILIGFMLPTWFLSMWISNTATTSMMIPVTEAVSLQLKEGMRKVRSKKTSVRELERANSLRKLEESHDSIRIIENGVDASNVNLGYDGDQEEPQETYFGTETISRRIDEAALSTDMETEVIVHGEEHADECDPELEKKLKDFSKMLCLAVAYSSNVGGTATLTGSPPNLLVAEFVGQVFESHGESAPLTYATWLFFGLPHAVICFLFLWAWLQFYHLGWRSFRCGVEDEFAQQEATIKKILRTEYDKLGPIKFGEVVTIILLVSMVFLWLARDPGFISGYASWFKKGYVTDAVPAIFIAIVLFMCPSERPDWICFRRSADEKARRVPALLDWNTVSTKLPWGPIILIGGGFALAEGCERSGLSQLIGEQMVGLSSLPTWVIAMITTTVIAFLTEITSNVAVIAVFLPILDGMAKDFGINPLYLMLPCGMAASYAFMLPIATPPNAIVFAYGHLKVLDMIKVGFLMNIICILVVTLGINTWGMAIFNVNEIPWSTESNANFTTISPPGCN